MSTQVACFKSDDRTLEILSPRRWLCQLVLQSGGGRGRGIRIRFRCLTLASRLVPSKARVLCADDGAPPSWCVADFAAISDLEYEALVSEAVIPAAAAPVFTGVPEVDAAMFSSATITVQLMGDDVVSEGVYSVEISVSPIANPGGVRRMDRRIVVDEVAYRSDQLGQYE